MCLLLEVQVSRQTHYQLAVVHYFCGIYNASICGSIYNGASTIVMHYCRIQSFE